MIKKRIFSAGFLIALLSGCATTINPIASGKAEVGYRSAMFEELVTLPAPEQPVVVAVYKFRDQTGQYKPSDTLSQYSTAVTQGATSMLIKALRDAGNGKWFRVLEREGLSNLFNERKIIRQTRQQYTSTDNNETPFLPPLLYAPVILEGGIVAYESNLLTGGLGVRYFGLGGATEYRRDTVTIYLRAISVKNGEVLQNINTSKTILSTKLDIGLSRFVSFKKLMEAEAGITSNEPPQMAVLEAIEKSVHSLIMEGLQQGLWAFNDKEQGSRLLASYLEEKNQRLMVTFDKDGNLVLDDAVEFGQEETSQM